MKATLSSFKYDAFISYRRIDGMSIATRLRRKLIDYKMPEDFSASAEKLSIYQDVMYEKATEDFFENNIQPALALSRVLIVVYTPSILEAAPNGGMNWVCREIEYFRTLQQGKNIWVAIGKGTFDDPLPVELDKTHPNIYKLDVRSLNNFFHSLNSDELAKIVAPLRNIPDEKLPEFRRENWQIAQKRRLNWMISILAIVILITIISIIAIIGWSNANTESLRQKAQRISFQAQNIPSGEFDLALLLAARANKISPVSEAGRSVLEIFNQNAHLVKYFHCTNGQYCRGTQFVGKTGWIAVLGDDQLCIYDIQSGKLITKRSERQNGHIKYIQQWDLLLLLNDSTLRSFQPANKQWTTHRWNYAGTQNIWETDSTVIVELPNNQFLKLTEDRSTGSLYAFPPDSVAIAYITQQKQGRDEIKNNQTRYFCGQRPVFRYDPPILFDIPASFIAFANEENQVIVKNQDDCYVLYGNTHNLSGIATQKLGDTIMIASYGQIGRNRYGVIVWNLKQVNTVLDKIFASNINERLLSTSHDGQLLALASTEGIRILDRNTQSTYRLPIKQETFSAKARFSNNNKEFSVVFNSGDLFHYSLGANISLKDTLQDVFDFAFDKEGNPVIITRTGDVLVKNKSGKLTKMISLNKVPQDKYHVDTDNKWIIVQRDTAIEAYNFNDRSLVSIPNTPKSSLYSCTGIGSAGGNLFFKSINTYDRAPIQIFSLETRQKIKEIESPFVNKSGLASTVSKIVVSEDGQYLIAQLQGDRSRIVIWQKEGTEYHVSGQMTIPYLHDFQYSSASKEIFIQNNDGIYTFSIDPATWVKKAQSVANRELTTSEIVNHNLQD